MSEREVLVQRKAEVQAALTQVRRELAHAEQQAAESTGLPRQRSIRRVSQLQAQADALMAEEARLRLAIDRSR